MTDPECSEWIRYDPDDVSISLHYAQFFSSSRTTTAYDFRCVQKANKTAYGDALRLLVRHDVMAVAPSGQRMTFLFLSETREMCNVNRTRRSKRDRKSGSLAVVLFRFHRTS